MYSFLDIDLDMQLIMHMSSRSLLSKNVHLSSYLYTSGAAYLLELRPCVSSLSIMLTPKKSDQHRLTSSIRLRPHKSISRFTAGASCFCVVVSPAGESVKRVGAAPALVTTGGESFSMLENVLIVRVKKAPIGAIFVRVAESEFTHKAGGCQNEA